jgi:hypothetical protein
VQGVRGKLAGKVAARGLTVTLAVAAFLVLALTPVSGWGAALAVAAAGAALVERRVRPAADLVPEQILLAAGVLVAYADGRSLVDWVVVAAGAVLIGLIMMEGPVRSAATLDITTVRLDVRPSAAQLAARIVDVVPALVALLAVGAAAGLPPVAALVVVLAVGGLVAALLASVVRRRFTPSAAAAAAGSRVRRALEREQPEFLLYFSAPTGSAYQVTMWLPYLERIGRPFFVLLREPEDLEAVAAATRAPVVVCPNLRAVDEAVVPSLRVAFYVNHGFKNTHCIRFAQLTHVQIHHGDSDKAASASPVTGIFDKIFVAGPAAIDRYARNGVDIPRDKFEVVGRPQVESIAAARGPIGDLADKVVLYAPTWTGHANEENYCSLPVGEAIVRALLARGATVLLRAHPYTPHNPESARQLARVEAVLAADRAATGRRHLWGAETTRNRTLVECFDRSDALVSDVSSVVSDYLFSGKPFAVADMVGAGDHFATRLPLAAAGYVIPRDLSGLDGALDHLLGDDPLAPARGEMRVRYLGPFPAETYAEAFLRAARRLIDPTPVAVPSARPSPAPESVGIVAAHERGSLRPPDRRH